MRSTFHGLETVKRGMFTQQSALYTTGHNIANANTPGYSRQRVNFVQTNAYPSPSMNMPQLPGQLGTGVTAGSIQRVRENFLDIQYRLENNKLGYYGMLSESLGKMEQIMNEPSDSGLHSVMEKFWNSLQDLASHTENTGARDVVASTGQMVADTLNYYHSSLTRIQNDLGNEITVKVKEINDIVARIENINRQIADVEPNGYLPNDLYDKRDLLVDELSKYMNIKVNKITPKEYGKADPTAEGIYELEVIQRDGSSYNPPVKLISVDRTYGKSQVNKLDVVDETDADPETMEGLVTSVKIGNQTLPNLNFSGELAGLIESYGYIMSDGTIKGHYPEMLEKLNKMTFAFASEFNAVHRNGYSLDATSPSGMDFFEFDPNNPIGTIKVNEDIMNNPALIAAGLNSGHSADNGNAQLLADIKSKNFKDYDSSITLPPGLSGSVDSFYSGIIGRLGVDAQSAKKDAENSQVLADAVEGNRQSVSSVSLDEEMTNMIKFQHAYNASARMISIIDEMIDKIINGMGIGGR